MILHLILIIILYISISWNVKYIDLSNIDIYLFNFLIPHNNINNIHVIVMLISLIVLIIHSFKLVNNINILIAIIILYSTGFLYNYFLFSLPEIMDFLFIKSVEGWSQTNALNIMQRYPNIEIFNQSELIQLYKSSNDINSLKINYTTLLEAKQRLILIKAVKASITQSWLAYGLKKGLILLAIGATIYTGWCWIPAIPAFFKGIFGVSTNESLNQLALEGIVGKHYIGRLANVALEQETTLNILCQQALNSNLAFLELIGLISEVHHNDIWIVTAIILKILGSNNLLNSIDLQIIMELRSAGAPESLLEQFSAHN